jgi:hypothetical protein
MALNKIVSEGIKDGEVKNADIATASVDINDINTSTGTAADDTYLRGDGKWMTPPNTTVGGGTGVTFNDDVEVKFGSSGDAVIDYTGSSNKWLFDASATTGAHIVFDVNSASDGYDFKIADSTEVKFSTTEVYLGRDVKVHNGANNAGGKLTLTEAGSNGSANVAIKCPDDKGSDASYTITLPSAAPTANGQSLTATTAGVASWSDPSAGATGGSTDKIFWENGQTVTTDYTIGDSFGAAANAMTAGPVQVNNGVTVTIPSGEYWIIL